ncbi:hypothetical protein C3E97_015675 [Pseudomonas sp. MWU12-2115]|nr:hypothetical protein C3E97_015675 [Pseudomonas sp. MWU12-2115]
MCIARYLFCFYDFLGATRTTGGSGLARESGVSVNIPVADTSLSRASPLPQGLTVYPAGWPDAP